MKHPNLHINHHNGSRNYVMPTTVKPSVWIRVAAWAFRFVPEPRVYYSIYFKVILRGHELIKKGDVYLDRASGVKLVVLRISELSNNRRSVQLCTLLPLKEKDRNKINIPLYLKYLGNTK